MANISSVISAFIIQDIIETNSLKILDRILGRVLLVHLLEVLA